MTFVLSWSLVSTINYPTCDLDRLRDFQSEGPWETSSSIENVHRPYNVHIPSATALACDSRNYVKNSRTSLIRYLYYIRPYSVLSLQICWKKYTFCHRMANAVLAAADTGNCKLSESMPQNTVIKFDKLLTARCTHHMFVHFFKVSQETHCKIQQPFFRNTNTSIERHSSSHGICQDASRWSMISQNNGGNN